MRTRVLVILLAVCGVLGFLLWEREERTPAAVATVAEKERQTPDSEQALDAADVAIGPDREELGPSPPVQDAEERWRKITELRGVSRSKDPIEEGACRLLLKLVDAETGAPQKGLVRLWRLGAPGNVGWSTGDQLQARAMVLHDGREFEDLPSGSYRAVSMDAAAGANYTEAFQVGGALTEHTLRIYAPREVETFVELFDTSGVRFDVIEVRNAGRSWRSVKPGLPPWLVERVAAREYVDSAGGGGGGGSMRGSHPTWKQLQADSRGFALGSFLQDSRTRDNRYNFKLRVPDGGAIDLQIKVLPKSGGKLAAVFMDRAEVLLHVVLPNGKSAAEAEVRSQVKAHPVAIDADHPDATWRDASIEVVIFRERRPSWSRVWKPSEGPMTDRWMPSDEH